MPITGVFSPAPHGSAMDETAHAALTSAMPRDREFVVDVRDEVGHMVLRARLSLVVESLPDSEGPALRPPRTPKDG
jgi:hypothetical protein